jgi:hypothetical protein
MVSEYEKYANIISGYDKCETKSIPDLEYYQCIYKLYNLPTDQVALFSKLHMAILKCKDCEYTHNWKFKNPKLCTNKAEADYYKTYNDCLLNYVNANKEEIEKKLPCTRNCNRIDNFISSDEIENIIHYSNCSYSCYKDITKKIVEYEPKVTTFINTSEGDKKSNTLSKFESFRRYSTISLMILVILTIY